MLNVITLVGRLTSDPIQRKTNSGASVGAFRVACNDGRKGPNGEKQEPLFIDCSIFGPQADTLTKYFRKGNLIGVYGRLVCRKRVNQQNVEMTYYSILADRIEFVEPVGESKAAEMPAPANDAGFSQVNPVSEQKNLDSYDLNSDDLPF